MKTINVLVAVMLAVCVGQIALAADVVFDVRSARDGKWSDARTWEGGKVPAAGQRVQVRGGHRVTYDVNSDKAIRMVHVAGVLSFSREVSTRLDVGLIKIQAGEAASEEGFTCTAHHADLGASAGAARPALEIGTVEEPIPAGVTATIRLVHFEGMDRETLPAIMNCGGRWDAHGTPMSRTWVKLGATSKAGSDRVVLGEEVTGWRVGDRVIVTASKKAEGGTYRPGKDWKPKGNTEQRTIVKIEGKTIVLHRALEKEHFGEGENRSEVANLSRNVVIESADPAGVRGHTMYHLRSTGGLSYVEFRHLGKEGVLGKYPVHFHLVRDSMRGSAVLGLSVWDSHNRWVVIHGTDYLLMRDCVGYQSVGHGFFLEDATEQYNVIDRNLAVQAYAGKRLPQQALPFDPNDGAGFWWANGRNTFTRNVACENDEYGFRFELAKARNFNPVLSLRDVDGSMKSVDVRTVPFLRFEGNESHSEGLYSFNFGDDRNPSVRGDKAHPFIARNLRAWETHYALRPNLQFFLMEGLKVDGAAYGVYHPDYDAHVYRDIHIARTNAEPINRGHDDESVQYGSFTYDGLTITDCRVGRDPLIQMACTSPNEKAEGHFRNVTIRNSQSRTAKVVDLGGGPRNEKLVHPIAYYFHDYLAKGKVTKVMSTRYPAGESGVKYEAVKDFTGKHVGAAEAAGVEFPTLLEPVDDLPPATVITSIRMVGGKMIVRGLSQDNGTVESVQVNGRAAEMTVVTEGIVEWRATIDQAMKVRAHGVDEAGNVERMGHEQVTE